VTELTADGLTRLVVLPEHETLRLDQFLAAATSLSRRRSRALAGAGLVWRNGACTRVLSRLVKAGDVIDVLRPHEELGTPIRPDLPPIDILWQDTWLVVANKPAGVLSQPAENTPAGSLACDQRMLLRLAVEQGRRPELHLVHRLDRVTSGVLLFSRHPDAAAPLQTSWAEGRVDRLYLAVIEGFPTFDETVVEAPIARDPAHSWRFKVSPQGRPAETHVRILARLSGMAFAACTLVTGRTHQVRVHMAHLGFPVMGDALYGGHVSLAPRPLLHAARLRLPHPRTGDPLEVIAPLPPDLTARWPVGTATGWPAV
jgi:23S rRNA pseudouridine1911/1915/1917 synthase